MPTASEAVGIFYGHVDLSNFMSICGAALQKCTACDILEPEQYSRALREMYARRGDKASFCRAALFGGYELSSGWTPQGRRSGKTGAGSSVFHHSARNGDIPAVQVSWYAPKPYTLHFDFFTLSMKDVPRGFWPSCKPYVHSPLKTGLLRRDV